MDTEHNNSWALLPIEGWKEANNTLDTLLYYEFAQATQRRHTHHESPVQSALFNRHGPFETICSIE